MQTAYAGIRKKHQKPAAKTPPNQTQTLCPQHIYKNQEFQLKQVAKKQQQRKKAKTPLQYSKLGFFYHCFPMI